MEPDIPALLREIQGRLELLESHLPTRNDPASLSLTAKIPWKAIEYREVLSWRFAELSRGAFENFKNDKLCIGIVLTRSAIETAAALWYLNQKIRTAIESNVVGDIDNYLMRLLMGSRTDPNMPDAINVLTFVKTTDREISGFTKVYDELSEYAHPNWKGTSFLYSKTDIENVWTDFGPNIRQIDNIKPLWLNGLNTILQLFVYSYNETSAMMKAFVELCERALNRGGKPDSIDY